MDRSIRGNERLRNADANLAIVADRAGMERQEGAFIPRSAEGSRLQPEELSQDAAGSRKLP